MERYNLYVHKLYFWGDGFQVKQKICLLPKLNSLTMLMIMNDDDDNDADEEDGCLVGQKICVCPNPRTLLGV